MQLHPLAGLSNLEMGKSDHRPIMLDTNHLVGVANDRPTYGRKFEAYWLAEETIEEIVKTVWLKALQRGLRPTAKLESVHRDMHLWDHRVLKEPCARLRRAQNELEDLM